MNTLYPLKFKPVFKEKIWGGSKIHSVFGKDFSPLRNCGESWELSAVQGNISVVCNGFLKGNNLQELIEVYLSDLVGEKIYKKFGIEFPLLIKFIDANDVLSIQVHPDDELAKKRHNAYGKTEMWYVLEADDDAEIITGFNCEMDKKLYLKHLDAKKLQAILNTEKTKKGDVFYIPSGRVHALGKGVFLAEIQQTSDITYRIYDWDRKDAEGNTRELHTDLALDAIDFSKPESYRTEYEPKNNDTASVIDSKYFTTNVIHFDKPVEKDYYLIDSFVVYICLDGSFDIVYNENNKETINKGETILLPAVLKDIVLQPHNKCEVLEVYIK